MILNFDILYIIDDLLHADFTKLLIKYSTKNKQSYNFRFKDLKYIHLYKKNMFDIRESKKFGLKMTINLRLRHLGTMCRAQRLDILRCSSTI